MNDEKFWHLIDKARDGNEESANPAALFDVLNLEDTDEVKSFMRVYTQKLVDSNSERLWDAGYIIAGGMSDDGFHYFRSWLIGKGRLAYETALREPDDLIPYIDSDEVENEGLEYVALHVLKERGDESDPREGVDRSPDAEPTGISIEEDDFPKKFPKLTAKFW